MRFQTPEQRIRDFERKQIIVSVLCLLLFSAIAILFNALHLQSVAEENTRFLSRMIKIGDFREVSLILHQARLSSFTTIRYQSDHPERSFVIPSKAEVFKDEGLLSQLAKAEIKTRVDLRSTTQSTDVIVFEYARFRLVPYAVLAWLIFNLISIPQTRFLKRRLIEQFNRDIEVEKKIAKSEIAQQVRHNLRTPLAALMRIPRRLPDSVVKDRELLEMTIAQIQELISKLDDRPNINLSEEFETDIYRTLEQARRELRAVVPKTIDFHFEIEDIVSSALVRHIPYELRSILGNLVTNSLESLNHEGRVLIRIRDCVNEIQISVADNGCGIKPESLPKIFDKHFSEGKSTGSGIGLSHARTCVESWSGSIAAESTLGIGTTLKVSLPIGDRASWYLPRLKFTARSRIFVLDDQESALELWRLKFEEAKLLEQASFLSSPQSLPRVSEESRDQYADATFLFDHDLLDSRLGLDLLKSLPRNSMRCLVTGHFDDHDLRRACSDAGVYLIPKSLVSELPIVNFCPLTS